MQDIDISASFDHHGKESAFRWACERGQLEVAQWLLSVKPDIDISSQHNYAFRFACCFGHLEVAQWLFSVKKTIGNKEAAFRLACAKGHLNVAQWLLSVWKDIDISASDSFGREAAFRSACFNGHLEEIGRAHV